MTLQRPVPLGGPKSRLLLFHVWKCGGSNLCNMAVRNGERVPNGENPNPSVRCDLGYALAPGGYGASNLMRSANDTFGAWQQPLPEEENLKELGDPKGEVAFLTILRNPLDQALSHYKHVNATFPRLFRNFSAFLGYGICARKAESGGRGAVGAGAGGGSYNREELGLCAQRFFSKDPVTDFPAWTRDYLGFIVFQDNQQLRWLLGGSFVTGHPELTKADLASARRRLRRFDDVLILEELHSRDRFSLAKYGWRDLNDVPPVGTRSRSNATHFLGKEEPSALPFLREAQRWDLELYEYGRKTLVEEHWRREAAGEAWLPAPAE